jgi:K+-sensing histidine kinase KdpD
MLDGPFPKGSLMSENSGNDVTLQEIVPLMVHDLNNPIAALGTNLRFLENLLGPTQSTEVSETLSDARMLCDVLRRLVSNLGMLGQTHPPPARRAMLDAVAMAMSSVTRLEKQAETSDVKLVVDGAFRTSEVFVESDPSLCERALDNVLTFAIERAVSRSSVRISIVKTEHIGVRVRCTTRPETMGVSAHPSRSQQLQSAFGRGLSLHCASLAAEAMGGRIDVRRDERDQLTIELRLHTDDEQIA